MTPIDDKAPPGRSDSMPVTGAHFVNGHTLDGPFPEAMQLALVGLGCFWGAERQFWELQGVHSTQVGYAGGSTQNPTYQEVCGGLTGHAEVVRVVFDPGQISYAEILRTFWESHNPTQGMRQGNDVGSQYRSCIFTYDEAQQSTAIKSRDAYQSRLAAAGFGEITTEIGAAPNFFFAESYHQQYLAKNPQGYCGLGGTGVCLS